MLFTNITPLSSKKISRFFSWSIFIYLLQDFRYWWWQLRKEILETPPPTHFHWLLMHNFGLNCERNLGSRSWFFKTNSRGKSIGKTWPWIAFCENLVIFCKLVTVNTNSDATKQRNRFWEMEYFSSWVVQPHGKGQPVLTWTLFS